jgi:hypothetical protein
LPLIILVSKLRNLDQNFLSSYNFLLRLSFFVYSIPFLVILSNCTSLSLSQVSVPLNRGTELGTARLMPAQFCVSPGHVKMQQAH